MPDSDRQVDAGMGSAALGTYENNDNNGEARLTMPSDIWPLSATDHGCAGIAPWTGTGSPNLASSFWNEEVTQGARQNLLASGFQSEASSPGTADGITPTSRQDKHNFNREANLTDAAVLDATTCWSGPTQGFAACAVTPAPVFVDSGLACQWGNGSHL